VVKLEEGSRREGRRKLGDLVKRGEQEGYRVEVM